MIKAKKSLGQNFLIDKNILEKITNITKVKDKTVLEIGPGTGNLTTYILKKKPKKIFVIEKDNELSKSLRNKFDNQITIMNEDVLKIDETNLFKEKVIVFGNLPYNISTEILSKWIINLKENFWFECLILMFQKEVADRIIAKTNTKNYGRLSIISNWKMEIEKIADIEPWCFKPAPKVKSTLLVFTPKKRIYNLKNPKNFEHITNIFFSQKRKMIKKPLKFLFKDFRNISEKLSLDLNLRPQNLNNYTYYKICEIYESLID